MEMNLTELRADTALDGVLVIHKPPGWTSHDVVAKVRRLVGIRKVGHTGTLDPAASGVLVLCLGKATRIAEYLVLADKAYRATLRLGSATDTQDATGVVVQRHLGPWPHEEQIRSVMQGFVGAGRQLPPMYSAVKVKGVPLYKAARAGRSVQRATRECMIHELTILSLLRDTYESGGEGISVGSGGGSSRTGPPLAVIVGSGGGSSRTGPPPAVMDVVFDVVCSKGTYVRTLCADIGERLGVGGHLAQLERRRVGRFGLEEALTLDELAEVVAREDIRARVHSLSEALAELPAFTLDPLSSEGARHGTGVPAARIVRVEGRWSRGDAVRLYATDGRLLAIGKAPWGSDDANWAGSDTLLKIEKVLV
jgi:tRNA pseudouridine55 synthase